MKKLTFLPIINLILLIVGLISMFVFLFPKEEVKQYGYVDNLALFSQFNMTEDLQKMKLPALNQQQKKIDSLYQLLQRQNNPQAIQEFKQKVYLENTNLQRLTTEVKEQINRQVWERLNSYLEEFGTEKEVHLIFGIQGNGNIMYADKTYDFTEEVIQFANNKYEGSNQ